MGVKKKLIRVLSALAFALILSLSLSTSVLAISNPTTGPTIERVDVYRHCLETNDMLILVQYYIDYIADPDESITEAYLGRFMSGATELANVAPYSFYNLDYNHGVFSMYFSEVEAPDWNGTYTVVFEGNPTLAWVGGVPSVSTTTLNKHSTTTQRATEIILGTMIMSIATQLSNYWSVELVESVATGNVLSSYGEQYFANVIPNIRTMVPNIFSGDIEAVVYVEKEHKQSYRDTLLNRWSGTMTEGAFSGLAAWTTLPLTVVKGLLWLLLVMFIAYFAAMTVKDTRPALFLVLLMMPLGNLIGMLSLTFTIVGALMCIIAIGYALFYQRASG